MKQAHGYEVKFADQKIIVTKKFAKAAGVVGSAEYTELAKVRHDFPDFAVELREIKKKEGKRAYGKLTYKAMIDFILEKEGIDAYIVIAEMENIKKLCRVLKSKGEYATVKSWFLDRYKDEFNSVGE